MAVMLLILRLIGPRLPLGACLGLGLLAWVAPQLWPHPMKPVPVPRGCWVMFIENRSRLRARVVMCTTEGETFLKTLMLFCSPASSGPRGCTARGSAWVLLCAVLGQQALRPTPASKARASRAAEAGAVGSFIGVAGQLNEEKSGACCRSVVAGIQGMAQVMVGVCRAAAVDVPAAAVVPCPTAAILTPLAALSWPPIRPSFPLQPCCNACPGWTPCAAQPSSGWRCFISALTSTTLAGSSRTSTATISGRDSARPSSASFCCAPAWARPWPCTRASPGRVSGAAGRRWRAARSWSAPARPCSRAASSALACCTAWRCFSCASGRACRSGPAWAWACWPGWRRSSGPIRSRCPCRAAAGCSSKTDRGSGPGWCAPPRARPFRRCCSARRHRAGRVAARRAARPGSCS
eukprot:284818393_1